MADSKEVQEVVLARYRDEELWTVSVSDSTFLTTLKNKGWKSEPHEAGSPYRVFRIPAKAVSIRSRSAVGRRRKISPASLEAIRKSGTRNGATQERGG